MYFLFSIVKSAIAKSMPNISDQHWLFFFISNVSRWHKVLESKAYYYLNDIKNVTPYYSSLKNKRRDVLTPGTSGCCWNDYPYHWVILDPKSKEDKVKVTNLKNSPKFLIFEFWNRHYTRHTFFSCFIRCANMKWIRWVLLKIQSGHDFVHRRTDGQTDGRTDGQGDTSIPPFQIRWSGGYDYPSDTEVYFCEHFRTRMEFICTEAILKKSVCNLARRIDTHHIDS